MSDLWFEDELDPLREAIETQVRDFRETGLTAQQLQEAARGVVRADKPRWGLLGPSPLVSGKPAKLWKVRLRFQFEPKSGSAHFVSVRCETYLEAVGHDEPMPTVFDLYPQELYEGDPRTVSLRFEPSIKVGISEFSLGEISTDIDVGTVAPVVNGFPGEEERAPYWELRPHRYPLKGFRVFWLVVEQPEGCTGIRLHARVEGVVQTGWGPIAVYPKQRVWANRPHVIIR